MASKVNSEFNYRYQILGNTPWERLKHLKGFLEGRESALKMEKVSELKYEGMKEEIKFLETKGAPKHILMKKKAELMEYEAHLPTQKDGFDKNREEIAILKKLIDEVYEIVEPTRLPGYTDEEMIELNSANEFTQMIGREIYAEIVATGRPSPAKVRNAMSNPYTLSALKKCGLLPENMQYIEGNVDPQKIEMKQTFFNELPEFMGKKIECQPQENEENIFYTGLEKPKE